MSDIQTQTFYCFSTNFTQISDTQIQHRFRKVWKSWE